MNTAPKESNIKMVISKRSLKKINVLTILKKLSLTTTNSNPHVHGTSRPVPATHPRSPDTPQSPLHGQ